MELLPADAAPGGQYRSNTFHRLVRYLGRDFGYASHNYDPTLEAATAEMLAWWELNREDFVLGGEER